MNRVTTCGVRCDCSLFALPGILKALTHYHFVLGRHIGLAIAEQLEKGENSFDPSRVAEISQEKNDKVLVDASSTNGLLE
jgi:hypothetical protein